MKKIRSAIDVPGWKLCEEVYGSATYTERRERYARWAYERGLKAAQQHFVCACGLLSLRYGNRFGHDHACGFGGGHKIPILDHATLWNFNGKPKVLLAEPYGSDEYHREMTEAYAQLFGLDVTVGDERDALHKAGSCVPLRFELGATEAQLEQQDRIRAVRRRRDAEEILKRALNGEGLYVETWESHPARESDLSTAVRHDLYARCDPLTGEFMGMRVEVDRERVDDIPDCAKCRRRLLVRRGRPREKDRKPHFRKIDDEWYVRGPLEALGGQTSVTVKRKDNTEVSVQVDPETLRPVPKEERTQWDGRKPHTVKVLTHDDSPDWTL